MAYQVRYIFKGIIYLALLCGVIVHTIDIQSWNYYKSKNGICEQYIKNPNANIKSKFQCGAACEDTSTNICIGFCFDDSSSTCTTYSILKFPNGGTVIRNHVAYKYFSTAKTFNDAHTACINYQAGLVLPKDPATNAFVGTFLNGMTLWLRATDEITEGKFVDKIGGATLSYSNFDYGQPDNFFLNEDCLEMIAGNLWNDKTCGAKLPYVCQMPSLELCPLAPKGNQEPTGQICYLKNN